MTTIAPENWLAAHEEHKNKPCPKCGKIVDLQWLWEMLSYGKNIWRCPECAEAYRKEQPANKLS